MNARDVLSHMWRDVSRRHNCETSRAQMVLDELLEAYSGLSRQYHTIDHIASLLRKLEHHGHAVGDHDAVAIAILFHDVVYDAQRHDNEERSAVLAGERLTALGFPDELVARVQHYIRATKHDQDLLTGDPGIALLLDLDLSALAAEPSKYRRYSEAIRREYGHVPEARYRQERRRILQGFLTRERIFRTDQLYRLWEQRARANLGGEIAELA